MNTHKAMVFIAGIGVGMSTLSACATAEQPETPATVTIALDTVQDCHKLLWAKALVEDVLTKSEAAAKAVDFPDTDNLLDVDPAVRAIGAESLRIQINGFSEISDILEAKAQEMTPSYVQQQTRALASIYAERGQQGKAIPDQYRDATVKISDMKAVNDNYTGRIQDAAKVLEASCFIPR
ncbi:MAG: hypothetical protein ACRCSF_12165 [Mycobacteriaceae bacterium]